MQQQLLMQQQAHSAQSAMPALSSGSPSLSESSSLKSLPNPVLHHLSKSSIDLKHSSTIANIVRGFDRFVFDSATTEAFLQHRLASSLSLDQPLNQMQLQKQQTQQLANRFVATQAAPYPSNNSPNFIPTSRSKFGTDNTENLRKLQALSEARHRSIR